LLELFDSPGESVGVPAESGNHEQNRRMRMRFGHDAPSDHPGKRRRYLVMDYVEGDNLARAVSAPTAKRSRVGVISFS
jgi:hypothetical protein